MERFLPSAFERYGERTALVFRDRSYSYAWLHHAIARAEAMLASREDVRPGTVVALSADYSPIGIAHFFALLFRGCIVSPISPGFSKQKQELLALAEVKTEVLVDDDDSVSFIDVGHRLEHPLLLELSRSGTSGLVLFSSGSAGKIKGVVHDAARLLAKYRTPRRTRVTIPFMLFDHIGGIHTLLDILSSGGTLVIARERTPEAICRLIERHRVEVLPATPTFLNLLLLSDYRAFDLSSLRYIAYSAERMPEASLRRLVSAFPGVEIVQNYGLSEVGIMRAKSEASGSLWMKLGGDGFATRVRDGLLEIKAETAMLGYLNEESPFTEDGWLETGDRVEVKGDYVRVLGRASDLIIIGGEKVYPAEVEDWIATMPGVVDVAVGAEANAITGQIVAATVQLSTDETRADFRARMSAFLADKLPPFKIPQRVTVTKEPIHTARFKKKRTR